MNARHLYDWIEKGHCARTFEKEYVEGYFESALGKYIIKVRVTSTFENVLVEAHSGHGRGLVPSEVEALGRPVWRKDGNFDIVKSGLIPHEGD